MAENKKYVPSLRYLTLFVLKEAEDYSGHNVLFYSNWDLNLEI